MGRLAAERIPRTKTIEHSVSNENTDQITGGCYCGAVRFNTTKPTLHQVNCHCSNCRRAVGAQSVAWITVPLERFQIVKGTPKRFRTDTDAWRTFCDVCGTSLTYQCDERPSEIDIVTGCLDDPEKFAPTKDIFADEKLSWVPEIA